jgi:hypothetical protein
VFTFLILLVGVLLGIVFMLVRERDRGGANAHPAAYNPRPRKTPILWRTLRSLRGFVDWVSIWCFYGGLVLCALEGEFDRDSFGAGLAGAGLVLFFISRLIQFVSWLLTNQETLAVALEADREEWFARAPTIQLAAAERILRKAKVYRYSSFIGGDLAAASFVLLVTNWATGIAPSFDDGTTANAPR